MIRNSFTAVCLVFAIGSCGQGLDNDRHQSSSKEIASPGPVDQINKLVWIEGTKIIAADCAANMIPIRKNCSKIIYLNDANAIKSFVKQGLSQQASTTTSQITTELTKLKDAHPTIINIKSDIDRTTKSITETKTALTVEQAKAAKLQSSIDAMGANIADYDQQIDTIKVKLKSKEKDAGLIALRKTLEKERTQLQQSLLQLNSDAKAQSVAIAGIEKKLAELNTLLENQHQNFEETYASLAVSSDELLRLQKNLSEINNVIAEIEPVFSLLADQDLVYRKDHISKYSGLVVDWIFSGFVGLSNIRLNARNILQVKYNNEWRGVCDDNFNENAGKVACRQMGMQYVGFASATDAKSFWLDDIDCNGNELDLFSCKHNAISTHNCSETENVALSCK